MQLLMFGNKLNGCGLARRGVCKKWLKDWRMQKERHPYDFGHFSRGNEIDSKLGLIFI